MSVLDHALDHPLKLEEHATVPLAGGIANHGYQCGMLWGAALATGAEAYRLYGAGPQAEAETIVATQGIVESFRSCTKNEINCLEITDINLQSKTGLIKLLIKGGPIVCLRMITKYTPKAFTELNSAFSETSRGDSAPPVSCTSILAQKMGASDMHIVMAAGLAGGIGLSGGACGALGTAIWIISMNGAKKGVDTKVINKRIADTIDRFIKSKSADFRFECSEITGRRFENVSDHAAYLQSGGCAEIIDLLAAETTL